LIVEGVVRVPGSSANLGPGFDVLALAIGMYLEVRATPSKNFRVTANGEGSELRSDANHMGSVIAKKVLGHDHVHLDIRSEIPLARGLGSSAAFSVAVATALGAKDPLSLAVGLEGHPENAAASYAGGLVAAGCIDGDPIFERLEVDSRIRLVLVVPRIRLSTEEARKTLAPLVQREDAVFNLQRAVLLSHALADITRLQQGLFDDRLHQLQRSQLFPQAISIIDVLIHSGAIGATWSGAGPTMIGFSSSSDAESVVACTRKHLDRLEIDAQVLSVGVDHRGVEKVLDS
jgi:homoserine kinase